MMIYSHEELVIALEAAQQKQAALSSELLQTKRLLSMNSEMVDKLAALVDSLREQRNEYAALLQARDPLLAKGQN